MLSLSRIRRDCVRRLLNGPCKAEKLYTRLPGYSYSDIDSALLELLGVGVIGVSGKRFFIRDRDRAMTIANEIG